MGRSAKRRGRAGTCTVVLQLTDVTTAEEFESIHNRVRAMLKSDIEVSADADSKTLTCAYTQASHSDMDGFRKSCAQRLRTLVRQARADYATAKAAEQRAATELAAAG